MKRRARLSFVVACLVGCTQGRTIDNSSPSAGADEPGATLDSSDSCSGGCVSPGDTGDGGGGDGGDDGLPQPACDTTPLELGGLTTYPQRTLGPELLVNGGFEEGLTGWSTGGFVVDATVAHSGSASVRITDADQIPYAQSRTQSRPAKAGPSFYRISAWVKTQQLGANGSSNGLRQGVRAREAGGQPQCSRGCGRSPVCRGTNDWMRVELPGLYLVDSPDGFALTIEAYGEPSGAAWLDNVTLEEGLPTPLEVVLRVPNYRANCLAEHRYGNTTGFLGTDPSDPTYTSALGQHPGLGGWYLAVECAPAHGAIGHRA